MFNHDIASTALIPVNLVFNLAIKMDLFLPALLGLPFSEDFIMKLKLFLWLCMSVPKGKRMQSISFLHRKNFSSHFAKGNFLQLPKIPKRRTAANLEKTPYFWILASPFSEQAYTHTKNPYGPLPTHLIQRSCENGHVQIKQAEVYFLQETSRQYTGIQHAIQTPPWERWMHLFSHMKT